MMSNSICHPFQGVCTLLNFIGAHLERADWTNPGLTKEMLPSGVRIVYKRANEGTQREDALPIVAYKVLGIKMQPVSSLSGFGAVRGATPADASVGISFIISTTSDALTTELGVDIGGTIVAAHKDLQTAGLYVAEVDVSEVQRDDTDYYICTVTVQGTANRPVWKKSSSQGILREANIQISNGD